MCEMVRVAPASGATACAPQVIGNGIPDGAGAKRDADVMQAGSRRSRRAIRRGNRYGILYASRFIVNGPGAWQMGIISIALMLTCSGSDSSQLTVLAISSAFSGVVP